MEQIRILGGRPLSGTVRVSGAKNAVLKIMAAAVMAQEPSLVRNVPRIKDVEVMMGMLEALGARVSLDDEGVLRVDPTRGLQSVAPEHLVREMRASIQVMGPILARLGEVHVSLPGGCAIGARPIDLHLRGLQTLGATIDEEHGYIRGRAIRLRGADIHLDVPSVGATENLIMAASLADGNTVIHNAAREPEIIEVQNFLNAMGGRVRGAGTDTIRIRGVRKLRGADYAVIPDRIEAGTFMAAVAAAGGDVVLENVLIEHLEATVAKLRETGLVIEVDGEQVRVVANQPLQGVSVRTQVYPGFPTDMQPQMIALLCRARGAGIVTENVHTSRFKHVDELRRMGADITVDGRTAIIRGVDRLTGAHVEASDLRAGAALAVAALGAEGETVMDGVSHLDRGYERLAEKLRGLGADVRRVPVADAVRQAPAEERDKPNQKTVAGTKGWSAAPIGRRLVGPPPVPGSQASSSGA